MAKADKNPRLITTDPVAVTLRPKSTGDVRSGTYGEGIGQAGWLITSEQDFVISCLQLTQKSKLLDVGSAAG